MKSFKILLFAVIILFIHSIAYSQSITVTSPNGGENWIKGTTRNITWTSSGITSGTFTVRLFDGTTNIGIIQAGIPCTDGAHSIPWIVGNLAGGGTASPGSNFKIKVRQASLAPNDFSDAPFTISEVVGPTGSITVTSPNGGENWIKGTTRNITWTSSGITTGTFTVRLFDGTTNIGIIQAGIPCTDGAHSIPWTVGNLAGGGTASLGSNFKIKVRQESLAPNDFSDAPFTISETGGGLPGIITTMKMTGVPVKRPDLKITMHFNPESPGWNQKTGVKFKVENIGEGDSKACKMNVFMAVNNTDTRDVPILRPGRSFSWTKRVYPPGVGWILWSANVAQTEDANQENNHVSRKMIVRGPDLKITYIYTPDGRKTIQQKFTFKVIVTNIGDSNSGYFELDADFDTCPGIAQGRKYKSHPGLSPGESASFTFTHKYICFKFYVWVAMYVDKKNQVMEKNESNNECGLPIEVQAKHTGKKQQPHSNNCK